MIVFRCTGHKLQQWINQVNAHFSHVVSGLKKKSKNQVVAPWCWRGSRPRDSSDLLSSRVVTAHGLSVALEALAALCAFKAGRRGRAKAGRHLPGSSAAYFRKGMAVHTVDARLRSADGRWVTGPPLLPGSVERWSFYLSMLLLRINSVKRYLYTTNSAFLTYKINTLVRTEKMPSHFRLGPWSVLFKKENVKVEET